MQALDREKCFKAVNFNQAISLYVVKTSFMMMFMVTALSGCQTMLTGMMNLDEPTKTSASNILKPLVAPRDVIDLEVFVIDRSVGDPLIGETLWNALSPISSLQADYRKKLTDDGFRYAMAPSRPPRPLQTLLSMSDDQDPSRRVILHRYSVQARQEAILKVSNPPDKTVIRFSEPESQREIEVSQAECNFKLTATRTEDDWVKVSILPVILHGANVVRPVATNEEWLYQERKETIPLYQHRLDAQLNLGEVIVLGMNSNEPDSIGAKFFRADLANKTERLILIRVVDARSVSGVKTKSH